jgi:Beta-lactamase
MSVPFSAGGLVSTVDDLLRWNTVLHGDGLLSRSSYERMTAQYPETEKEDGFYGYGLFIAKTSGHTCLSHSGGVNGLHRCASVLSGVARLSDCAVQLAQSPGYSTGHPTALGAFARGIEIVTSVKVSSRSEEPAHESERAIRERRHTQNHQRHPHVRRGGNRDPDSGSHRDVDREACRALRQQRQQSTRQNPSRGVAATPRSAAGMTRHARAVSQPHSASRLSTP